MNIPKIFTVYCMALLLAFVFSANRGYVYSALWASNQRLASKTSNQYHK